MPSVRPRSDRSQLRAWQSRALAAMARWESGPFLLSAAPGAGKTRPALEFARRQLEAGTATAVVVACPTAPLTRQWARAAHDLGIDLAPDAESPAPPTGFHGVSVTYARVAKAPLKWAGLLPPRTLVIADDCGPETGVLELVARLNDPRITYVRNPKNLGLAGNWNRCLDAVTSPLFTLLHADDELLPNYVETMLAAADRHPDVGFGLG